MQDQTEEIVDASLGSGSRWRRSRITDGLSELLILTKTAYFTA
jgi:hypothetical protein